MKIFMTGATGVVGRRVIPLLVAEGHEVTMINLATHMPSSSFKMMFRRSWRMNDRIRLVAAVSQRARTVEADAGCDEDQ